MRVVLVGGVVGHVGGDVGGRLVPVRVSAAHVGVVGVQCSTVGLGTCDVVAVRQDFPDAAAHVLLVVETSHGNGDPALDGVRGPVLRLRAVSTTPSWIMQAEPRQ